MYLILAVGFGFRKRGHSMVSNIALSLPLASLTNEKQILNANIKGHTKNILKSSYIKSKINGGDDGSEEKD